MKIQRSRASKSLLKLGKEFQPVNYDTTVSSTAIVFTRFIQRLCAQQLDNAGMLVEDHMCDKLSMSA